MGLNFIKSNDKWGKASSDINTNFTTIQTSVEKIKNNTTKFKGYFESEEVLLNKFPTPSEGETAWVGTPYPGTVYTENNGAWENTQVAPETPAADLSTVVMLGEENQDTTLTPDETTSTYSSKSLQDWDGNDIRNATYVSGISDYESFSNLKQYYAGETAVYNNRLYSFTKDHIGDWTGDDVEPTSLIKEQDKKVTELGKELYNSNFIGKDTEFSYRYYKLFIKGRKYRIIFHNENWNVPVVGETYTLFQVILCNNDLEINPIVKIFPSDTRKKEYTFTIPNTDDFNQIKIGGRAVLGEVVRFSIYDITDIRRTISLLPDKFDIPNIDTVNGTISLHNSIILIGSNSYELGVIWANDESKYNNISLKDGLSSATKLIFNETTKELYCKQWDKSLSIDEYILGSIRTNVGEYTTFVAANFIFDYSVNGRPSTLVFNGVFIGEDSVFSYRYYYNFVKGRTYKLVFDNENWEVPEIGEGYTLFQVILCKDDAELIRIVKIYPTDTRNKEYIFTVPDNYDFNRVKIGGRAVYGEPVNFSIYDITDIKRTISFIPNANNIPNIDTINGTISLYNGIILIDSNAYELGVIWDDESKYNNIPLKDGLTSATKLIFNETTKELYCKAWNKSLNSDEFILGGIRTNYGEYKTFIAANFIFDYTIDGDSSTEELVNRYQYYGEKIEIRQNKYDRPLFKNLSTSFWHQSMDIYNNILVQMIHNYNTDGVVKFGKLSAHIFDIITGNLLGSVDVPYEPNGLPHCNTINFGTEFGSENSIAPLLYVSQWDTERKCLVYDIQLVDGVYTFNLVQTIATNISDDIQGAGMRDWVVDTENNSIYSFAYYINSDSQEEGNKTMICKFDLPNISAGENVVLTDDDIKDNFEMPFFKYFQEKCINGNKMYILSGMTNYQSITNIRVLDLITKKIVTIIPLGDTFNSEPEGIAIYKNKLLIDYGGNSIYSIETK